MQVCLQYETTVEPHLKDLYKYCLYLSGSVWDGEDLYQDALLKSLRYFMRAGVIRDARPFLFRVARNLWIDEYRTRERKKYVELTKELQIIDGHDLEIRYLIEWLASQLSNRNMKIWLLAEYFGYTMNEIAAQLQISMSAVRSALHRARQILRSNSAKDYELIVSKQRSGKVIDLQVEQGVRSITRENPRLLFRQPISIKS